MIPLTSAIPELIRGGLRRCAIQIDVYFTSLVSLEKDCDFYNESLPYIINVYQLSYIGTCSSLQSSSGVGMRK